MADVFRRLHGPALQRADAGQPDDRQEPHAGVDRAAERGRSERACSRRRPRGRPRRLRRVRRRRGRAGDRRRRGYRRVRGRRRRQRQGRDPPGQRRPLRHGAGQRLGARRARRTRALALLLEDEGRHAHRQPRRGHLEQLSVLRDARQLPRLARRAHRQGTVARRDRRLRSAVLLHDGADRRRRPRAGRNRQRPRLARLPAVVRPGDGQAQMDLLHRADEGRRPGARHVAEPGGSAAWRRPGVDPGLVRPGDEALHLRHRESDAGLHRRGPQRRQPLHLHARRRQRRHGQDGVVLPDVGARHARLGLGADARSSSTPRSTASRASSSRPPRATATSTRSIA